MEEGRPWGKGKEIGQDKLVLDWERLGQRQCKELKDCVPCCVQEVNDYDSRVLYNVKKVEQDIPEGSLKNNSECLTDNLLMKARTLSYAC